MEKGRTKEVVLCAANNYYMDSYNFYNYKENIF